MKVLFAGTTGMVGGIVAVVMVGAVLGFVFTRNGKGGKVLTDVLSEPLNNATSAKVDISAGSGNLTIDRITSGEPMLATGELEYIENQGIPARTVNTSNGQAVLTLKTGITKKPGFHLPWEACNSEFDWQIHLNPAVATDLKAHSGGGNVKLDLSGSTIASLSTDTGGGNVDLALPDHAASLTTTATTGAGNVTITVGSGTTGSNTLNAKSGAGNVVIHLPAGIAARVSAKSGVGKVSMDARFSQVDKNTYQTADYDTAANKIEITMSSGAGNVIVDEQ